MAPVHFDDFTITIAPRQGDRYPVVASAGQSGRTTRAMPPIDGELHALLEGLAGQAARLSDTRVIRQVGSALFRWLITGSMETHFRVSWDRATRAGHGFRLRLSMDPPEIASLPWELLHDPQREHTFATSAKTPLVRFFDQADTFGPLADAEAEPPLAMLLVLPEAPELDLAGEKKAIREATEPLHGALNLHLLEGCVTGNILSDTLMATPFDIMHVSSHGAVADGESYVRLSSAGGAEEWVEAEAFVRLLGSTRSLKLVVLNACSVGQVASGRAWHGLAPLLVRAGVPAVVAMQYVVTDPASLTFAREFYRQLCTGQQAGQVDIAVAHARNMLAARFPASLAFAAPVLFTHAAEGIIYRTPEAPAIQAVTDPGSESARLAMFMNSLQASMEFVDDWALAGREQLEMWQRTLVWAEKAYTMHLSDPQPACQQAARHGLGITQSRLATIARALEKLD